jgi:DNA-binding NtrC family response regulator
MSNNTDFKIFIVEDDPWYGNLLMHHLSLNPDYDVSLYTTGKEVLKALPDDPDLLCMDYGLPDIEGEKLIKQILKVQSELPIIVISGQEDISVAVSLLKTGAKDYIVKDDHAKDILWKSIINIRENLSLRKEVEKLQEELKVKYDFEDSIIGQSPAIKKTFKLVQKAIKTNINVSLTGETGTGKEVYAKAIHFNSKRRKQPFVAVNMGAISKDLAESELFGHEKGAFTGAAGTKKGKFEEADGGTLFLDEIAEMDLGLQTKLLRVLQEREVVRVGGNKPIPIDIRLISATHKNLTDEVKEGNFREDLYFRIIGLPIELPPLRDRDNDVLILAKHFIEAFSKDNQEAPPSLSSEAKKKLKEYPFPGNVRELKAAVELACVMSENQIITEEDLTFSQISNKPFFAMSDKTLKEYNNEIISYFLDKNDGNVLQTAKKLDIGKSTIYNLIKEGDISVKK